MVHARVRRSLVQHIDEPANLCFVALDMRFDGTVGTISDPTVQAQPLSVIAGPGTEEHALHAPSHTDVPRDDRHHTVAMSGASSAFMPTTL